MAEVNKNPETRQTGKAEQYIHIITDANFDDFYVLNSANGWWLDRWKVEQLIKAYKIDCSDEEACAYAGITPWQLRDFKELHDDFQQVKMACKQLPFLTARNTIVAALATDGKMALDYMERKRKHEFGKRDEHVILPTEKTLEDLFDEYDKENDIIGQQNTNRETAENKEQAGAGSAVPAEHSPAVLLGQEAVKKPGTETKAKGVK